MVTENNTQGGDDTTFAGNTTFIEQGEGGSDTSINPEETSFDQSEQFFEKKSNLKRNAVSAAVILAFAGAAYFSLSSSGLIGGDEPAPAQTQEQPKLNPIPAPVQETPEPQAEGATGDETAMTGEEVSPEISKATESLGDTEDQSGENEAVPPAQGELGYIGGDTTGKEGVEKSAEVAAATAPVTAPAPAPAPAQVAEPVKAVSAPAKVAPAPAQFADTQQHGSDSDARIQRLEARVAELEGRVAELTRKDEDNRQKISSLEKKLADYIGRPVPKKVPKKPKPALKDLALLNEKKVEPAKVTGLDIPTGGDGDVDTIKTTDGTSIEKPSYTGTAIISDRAWLTNTKGGDYTVTIGDELPGYGEVIRIDDRAGELEFSSGAKIKFW